MNASNKLCEELLPDYSNFEKLDEDTFIGYKLVEKKNLNYYSIVTGMFRYKSGKIGPSSYSGLYYKNGDVYNEHLKDRMSVFTSKEDAHEALIKYKDICNHKGELVLIEIEMSGDLEVAKYKNNFVENLDVVIGNTMGRIKEVEYEPQN